MQRKMHEVQKKIILRDRLMSLDLMTFHSGRIHTWQAIQNFERLLKWNFLYVIKTTKHVSCCELGLYTMYHAAYAHLQATALENAFLWILKKWINKINEGEKWLKASAEKKVVCSAMTRSISQKITSVRTCTFSLSKGNTSATSLATDNETWND